ncbi:MAG: glycosyltransferase family 4 protein [Candidatus Omnitrophota bacterium]|nr:glycosyltransferase family 4 protein [Candidatus Omnitrophota bacterium]MBU1929365.1 glycosyltransferase family 4 protein [Candidatus Omnitrophota bacterium]MBU2035252.1 glycosyltransferase family 4 protein [Candidatus Omnitrophota bacterium]MBU2257992.1 glycosyltransferase family 4 protein [Candidatus Omnitrophota bacterium]
MKIAIVGTRGIVSSYSGVEASVSEIVKRLDKGSYRITVYCRKAKDNKAGGNIYNNIKLIYIPTIETKHLATILHTFISAIHALFSGNDIVHFHCLGPALFSFLPGLFGKKAVVTIHALDWKRKKWGILSRLFLKLCEYPAIWFPHRTIVVSKVLRDYFENKFGKKVYYIPNGVSFDSCPARDDHRLENGRYILFVGRLVPEKGIHYLIKAFNELKTDFKLIIAGEPSFTGKYFKHLKEISGKNVRFVGFVEKNMLKDLYQRAYLFVLPSDVEGLPVSLLEGMSYGKCVLTSDIPECVEVTGSLGVYFKVGDYLDLKDKLNYLINNPDLIKEKGAILRKWVFETYEWDKIAEGMGQIYTSLFMKKWKK